MARRSLTAVDAMSTSLLPGRTPLGAVPPRLLELLAQAPRQRGVSEPVNAQKVS